MNHRVVEKCRCGATCDIEGYSGFVASRIKEFHDLHKDCPHNCYQELEAVPFSGFHVGWASVGHQAATSVCDEGPSSLTKEQYASPLLDEQLRDG